MCVVPREGPVVPVCVCVRVCVCVCMYVCVVSREGLIVPVYVCVGVWVWGVPREDSMGSLCVCWGEGLSLSYPLCLTF